MIVVRLRGGLANQMFQYAAARGTSLRAGCPLRLDLETFQPGSPRSYALDAFVLEGSPAPPDLLREIHGPTKGLGRTLHRWKRRLGVADRWTRFHEEWLCPVDPKVVAAPPFSFLDGYWQSEGYFADVADTIRRDFALRDPLNTKAAAMAERIGGCLAVSVHVRRGDYVSNPATNRAHGTCSVEYYQAAARMVAEQHGPIHLFVFSDDPAWVAANLTFAYSVTLVSQELDGIGADEMRLMSLCRHHIIANSSFSWWGAWLNPRADKMVVAPKRWGNDPRWDDRDLIPRGWTRL